MSHVRRYILFIILFLGITFFQILTRTVSLWGLGSWFVAIFFTFVLLGPDDDKPNALFDVTAGDIVFLSVTSICYCAIAFIISQYPYHFHWDEFVTAYTSYTLPPIRMLDWFEGYPLNGQWVAPVPILFFILQKPFLLLLGHTVNAVRISVWPYHILILWYLYFLAKRFFRTRIAVLTTLLFIFFGANMYLASLGVHFHSSTAFYLATLYHFLVTIKTKDSRHAKLAGVWLAMSFLTYASSFAILPVMITIVIVEWIGKKDRRLLRLSGKTLLIALVILAPFLLHAWTGENYFLERTGQVNVFWGSQSDVSQKVASGASVLQILKKQSVDAVLSLFQQGIGGTDYNFGNQALFDPFSAILFVLGAASIIYNVIIRRQKQLLYLTFAIIIPFVFGFILTTQPPPFQRISVIYPLFALMIALSLDSIVTTLSLGYPILRKFFLPLFLFLYIVLNAAHLSVMVFRTVRYMKRSVDLAPRLDQTLPNGASVAIAAFPTFHLERELFFRTKKTFHYTTDDVSVILQSYSGGPLILPDPTDEMIAYLTVNYPFNIVESIEGDGNVLWYFYPPENPNDAIINP